MKKRSRPRDARPRETRKVMCIGTNKTPAHLMEVFRMDIKFGAESKRARYSSSVERKHTTSHKYTALAQTLLIPTKYAVRFGLSPTWHRHVDGLHVRFSSSIDSPLPIPSRRRPTPKLTLSPRHQSFRLCSSYHLIRFPREHPQLHRRTRDERRPERPEEHGGGAEEGRTPGHHVASVFIGCLLRRFDVRRVVECWLVTEHAFPRAQNPFPFIRPGARKNRKLFFSADL